ncbi:MAG: hypothetical protein K9N55_05690 [Phycisphaerae bacterium]|nr:hypothetical protein [Phycisphaerae bacterium]
MFDLLKVKKAAFTSHIHMLCWYPSDRSCTPATPLENKPKKVPPLMVRKAEWRR